MARIFRHRLLAALLLGAVSATGFAPLGLWPVTLACVAALLWLVETSQPAATSGRGPGGGPKVISRQVESPADSEIAENRQNPDSFRFNLKRNESRQSFFTGWCFGLGQFTVGLNWIAHAFTYQDAMPHWLGYIAVVLLSLYLAIFPGLAALGLHLLRARWPALPATLPFAALWIVTEMGRATLFTGFAWNPLAMVWLGTGVDQSAKWLGTYGLSGLAVLAAGALLALARRRWHIAGPALAALLALGILGHVDLRRGTAAPGVPITVVQPNIDQNEKYDPALEQANFAKLAALTGPSSAERPRLVFWPEAALEAWLDMEPEWRARVAGLLGPNDLLLTGGVKVYFEDQQKNGYTGRTLIGANNSAWVVTPGARLIARYDKAHLVPYGEYLPMRGILEPIGLSRLVPGATDFWPGPGPQTLALPAGKGRSALGAGVQICYEIIFSGQVIDRANRPDFIYNPSNDAWFGSWGPPQHMAQARMRAIEEAMPVIRSTPTGISTVIDADGRVLDAIPHHQAGAIDTRLPPAMPPTLFARIGNALPLAFALALIALSVATARFRR